MTELERTLIFLLQREVEALRNVLSEWEQDKSCYLQWSRAEDLRAVIENLEPQL